MSTDNESRTTSEVPEVEGDLEPESLDAAREAYAAEAPTAKIAVREAAKAMGFDSSEYEERVTPGVIATVREALFAERLAVRISDRETYESWGDTNPEFEVIEIGSPEVDRIAWHVAPFADQAVGATFHEKRMAAVSTVRKQAFGRIYRERLESDS